MLPVALVPLTLLGCGAEDSGLLSEGDANRLTALSKAIDENVAAGRCERALAGVARLPAEPAERR